VARLNAFATVKNTASRAFHLLLSITDAPSALPSIGGRHKKAGAPFASPPDFIFAVYLKKFPRYLTLTHVGA
jgi:hypothetical protein